MTNSHKVGSGLMLAVLAYIVWGFLPLYFRALHGVPPLELVGLRVLFTLPVCLAIVAARRQGSELIAALRNARLMAQLALSALLIGANWLIYVIAINNGHVLAASLGYYINPLVNVLLGTALLGERLRPLQWTAVGIAALGIALLLWGALDMLGVAMSLALTFAFYGFVRKLAPVGAVPGLTVETMILMPPAIAVAGWFAQSPAGTSLAAGGWTPALLALSGVATAIPLMLFAVAARRLDLSTLGFVQFLSPTIAFVLGLTVFGEPLSPVRAACFVLIWAAIALYSWDMLANRSRRS